MNAKNVIQFVKHALALLLLALLVKKDLFSMETINVKSVKVLVKHAVERQIIANHVLMDTFITKIQKVAKYVTIIALNAMVLMNINVPNALMVIISQIIQQLDASNVMIPAKLVTELVIIIVILVGQASIFPLMELVWLVLKAAVNVLDLTVVKNVETVIT